MKINIGLSKIFAVTCILFASASSYAVDFMLEAGLHFGGDELVAATFTSGNTETIEAGGFYNISAGVAFDISDKVVSRVTLGFKEDSITAGNGDISFSRNTIDALFLYKTDQWLFGGGLTYHTSVKLSGSGLASGIGAEFDNALGFLLEVDYMYSKKAYVGGRYTVIDYDTVPSTTVNAVTVDGNSIGVVVGYRF